MAEIGLGYGSEFQLMRFLGHHRNELNDLIHKATNTNELIEWLDFPYNDNKISGDGEWKGIECFSELLNYDDICEEWKKFWPQSGNAMNWDGIFKIKDAWHFVEAKAHKKEAFQECCATSNDSINKIDNAFEKTKKWLNIENSNNWRNTKYYQLANRLAFIYFCNEICKINAKLIYIGFVNGFEMEKDEIHSSDEWKEIWEEEMKCLGLDIEKMSQYIYFIHPDCNPKVKTQLVP